MSFASTCSLNLGLCLQSEELKHSQLTFFSSSDVFQVLLKTSPERNIKEMQSRAAEQIHQWRWKPVPKDLMNSRVEGYGQIWAAHSSGLLLRMYFPFFYYLKGKLPPNQLCRRQQGWPGEWAQTGLFITGKCELLWEGVSVTQAVSIWAAVILCGYNFPAVIFVRNLLVSITRCVPGAEPRAPQPSLGSLLHLESEFPQHNWIFSTPEKLFCQYKYSREVISSIVSCSRMISFFLPVPFPKAECD